MACWVLHAEGVLYNVLNILTIQYTVKEVVTILGRNYVRQSVLGYGTIFLTNYIIKQNRYTTQNNFKF